MKSKTITLRDLTVADAEPFMRLRLKGLLEEPDAFTSSYEESKDTPIEVIAERLKSDHDSFVLGVFDGEDLVGLTGIHRYKEGKKVAHKGVLWGVYLLPEYRGKGLAKTMLLSAIEKARKLPGLELLHLGVNPDNPPVVKLYESVGFQKWGFEKHALKIDGRYVDEDQMVLFFV